MAFNPLTGGFPAGAAEALELVVGLEIDATAAGRPRLGAGAPWVRLLPQVLARAGKDARTYRRLVVRITAIYDGATDAATPPDMSVSDYDPGLLEFVAAAFAGSAWEDLVSQIDVREEWRPGPPFRIVVGLYGQLADIEED